MGAESFESKRPSRGGRGRTSVRVVLALLGALLPSPLFALGFRIPNQDPTAIGRGNAFAATADNPSALYYNPAGITQCEGHQVQIGSLFYLGVAVDYTAPSGIEDQNQTEIIPVPHFHYVFAPADLPVAFGLGAYAPFGLAMEWPEPNSFRNLALEAKLEYMTLNPVVAWEIVPSLSVAAGATINYSEIEWSRGLGLVPGDQFTFEGDDVGYGFNLGLRWQLHPKWAIGLQYRSATTLDYDGTAAARLPPPLPSPPGSRTSAEIDFPQIISGGVSFRPTPRWNLEINIDWADWNQLDVVELKGVTELPFHWESSFFYEIGVTHSFENRCFLSAGYFFSENTVPDAYFSPLIPDTDLHVASLGGGYRGERWQFAVSGQIITGPTREVEGSPPGVWPGETADGGYRIFTPTLSVSLGVRF